MNRRLQLVLFVLFFCIEDLQGCHDKGKGNRAVAAGVSERPNGRVKRSTDGSQDEEVEDTGYLRDFFSNCLRNKIGDIWNWGSVVDVSVLDSQWYRNSDVSNCSEESGDSVFCWQLRLNEYLKQTSPLLQETRNCMVDYNTNVTADPEQPQRARRVVRQTSRRERCTDFYTNSPKVREYGTCNKDIIALTPTREEIDFPSVIQFMAENTLCGPEFPDCDANGEETISKGDPSVPSWPYRFEALMRKDTPVRDTVLICNNLVYPSFNRTGAEWSEWGAWSNCPVCGLSREQERTRQCNIGTSCPGLDTETRACEKGVFGNNYFGFTATQSPGLQGARTRHWTFGGEPGYPGSRGTRSCFTLIRRPCLSRRKTDECNCQRFGCCWHATTKTCFKPTYIITQLRKKCPPGFKNNPPRCDPIIVCDSNPCLNGGTCVNKINGFECQCPPSVTGDVCQNLCGPPPISVSVAFNPVKVTYELGNMVTYTCSGTNTIQGSSSNTCTLGPGNTGVWMHPSPSCTQGCTAPSTGAELSHVPLQAVYAVGQSITYSCNPSSLTLVGQHILICRIDGTWNPANPPTCSGTVCGPVPAITVGLGTYSPIAPINLPIGQLVTYTCSPGYFLVGLNSIQCLSGAVWSDPAPQCHRGCGSPPAPLIFGGGTINILSTSPSAPYPSGTQAAYSCSMVGYQIPGDSVLLCQPDGTWLPAAAPTCQKDCLNLPIPNMGVASPPGISHPSGTLVTYSCLAGYALRGPSTNVCQGDLTWSNGAPECRLECPAPPGDGTPDPSHVTAPNYVEGDTITYVCTSGNPDGPVVNFCSGGVWSISEPTCGLTNCRPLPTIAANGFNNPPGTAFTGGQTVTYRCNSGYVLVGSSFNTCQFGTLTWPNLAPSCVLDCGAPPVVQFSTFTGVTGVGQTINYVCNTGFNLVGNSANTCMDVGGVATWGVVAPNLPTCVQGCTAPPSGPEVFILVVKAAYAIGEIVTYRCFPGKNIVGATENECIAINTWKNVSPTCSATVCPPTPSLTGGSFTPSANLGVGEVATYSCDAGFTLSGSATANCINGIPMPELVYAIVGVPPSCTAYCAFLPVFPPQATAASPVLTPAGATAPYQHGTVAKYECNPGFVGARLTQTCAFPDFQFTPLPGPECLQGCPGPVPIKPGVGFSGATFPFKEGDTVTYICVVPTQQLIGPFLTNRCTAGDWEVSPANSPECRNECVNPPMVANGAPISVQATYVIGERVFYTCLSATILVGVNFAECQPDLTWSNPGECNMSCGALPFDASSLVVADVPGPYLVGDTVNYICIAPTFVRYNHVTDGNECLVGGFWRFPLSSQAGICREVCVNPPAAPNGFFTPLQTTYSPTTTITYMCFVNYHLLTPTSSVCTSQAGAPPFWSNPAVNNCRRVCSDPAIGARVTITGAPPYLVGMLVLFSCTNVPFLTIVGATNAVCGNNGQWTYNGGVGFPLCVV